jgi:hypothetical protein
MKMATITLQLPEDIGTKLKARAEIRGCDISKAALEILEQELREPAKPENPNDLPFEEWQRRYRAMVENVPQVNVGFVDDSRESIYEGRGE